MQSTNDGQLAGGLDQLNRIVQELNLLLEQLDDLDDECAGGPFDVDDCVP